MRALAEAIVTWMILTIGAMALFGAYIILHAVFWMALGWFGAGQNLRESLSNCLTVWVMLLPLALAVRPYVMNRMPFK